jgi:hypothetical protein
VSHQRTFLVLASVFSFFGIAQAQIIEFRQIGDKRVTCARSGLTSSLKDCGMRSDWYAYVFVGTISAIRPIRDDEKEIQITPHEVFSGKPASSLTIRTSQAPCLPEIAVGDRWLFFLREERGKPTVLDYGSDSRPLSEAQKEIETLRRLQTIGDFAIVRGRVVRGSFLDGKAVPFARVVAHRTSDNTLFATTASSEGYYEFPPLPHGKYTFSSDALGLPDSDEGWLDTPRGACWDLTLDKEPNAQLGGHVRRSDGSPMPDIDVLIMSADQTWFTTAKTDSEGYFHDEDLRKGKYLIGINLPGAPLWQVGGGAGAGINIPRVSLYYPGVQNRSAALAIELKQDETRNNIDFSISPQ